MALAKDGLFQNLRRDDGFWLTGDFRQQAEKRIGIGRDADV
jgi:hypothetical protein